LPLLSGRIRSFFATKRPQFLLIRIVSASILLRSTGVNSCCHRTICKARPGGFAHAVRKIANKRVADTKAIIRQEQWLHHGFDDPPASTQFAKTQTD
jgi:hypothetical protein